MATVTLYATSHITGTFSNPTNAVGSGTGTWAGDLNANSNYTSRWAMGDPVDPLTQGATHTISVVARKGSNSGNPTIALNLYENGTLVQSLVGATSVTSTTGQTISGTFPTSAITDRTAVEVEVVQVSAGGGPSARNSAQIDTITWTADTTAAQNLSRTAGDTAGASDATTRFASVSRSTTDTAPASEGATRSASVARSAADTLTASETATRTASRARSAADTTTLSDLATKNRTLVRAGAEATTTTDSVIAESVVARYATDFVTVTDSARREGSFTTVVTAADSAPASDAVTRTSVYARYNPRRAG